MEYAVLVWELHLNHDVEIIEKLQIKVYIRNVDSDLREHTGSTSINNRRKFLKLCTLYKIM